MRARALSLALAAPLAVALAGCGAALKSVYHAASYRMAKVPTAGMLPTIRPGDGISFDEAYYRQHPFERFDVVVFSLPPENIPPEMPKADEATLMVKRVVALGGETVEVKGGRVYVNNAPLEEPFETVPLPPRDRFGPVTVPGGELFLMGDNRPNSLDGRSWTRPTLPVQYVRGRLVEIFH